MDNINERKIDPIEEMARIAIKFLKLPVRGFKESYSSSKLEILIYDSEWCRLNLMWGGWDFEAGNSMHILYGRLHAPSEKATMIWDGEECYCWHRVEHALHFLDGRTVADTVRLNYSHHIKKLFYEKEILEKFNHRQPELQAQIHATIWEAYGNRLFELFDLRRPEQWQQYRQFLRDVYDVEGRDSDIMPPLDNVC